jgi:hypothetical protein
MNTVDTKDVGDIQFVRVGQSGVPKHDFAPLLSPDIAKNPTTDQVARVKNPGNPPLRNDINNGDNNILLYGKGITGAKVIPGLSVADAKAPTREQVEFVNRLRRSPDQDQPPNTSDPKKKRQYWPREATAFYRLHPNTRGSFTPMRESARGLIRQKTENPENRASEYNDFVTIGRNFLYVLSDLEQHQNQGRIKFPQDIQSNANISVTVQRYIVDGLEPEDIAEDLRNDNIDIPSERIVKIVKRVFDRVWKIEQRSIEKQQQISVYDPTVKEWVSLHRVVRLIYKLYGNKGPSEEEIASHAPEYLREMFEELREQGIDVTVYPRKPNTPFHYEEPRTMPIEKPLPIEAKVESIDQLTSIGLQMIRVINEIERHQVKKRIPILIKGNVMHERASMAAIVSRYIIYGQRPEEISKFFKEKGLNIDSSEIKDIVRHAFARTLQLERESQEKANQQGATSYDRWFSWRSLTGVVKSIQNIFPAGEVTTQAVEMNLVGLMRQVFDILREKNIDIYKLPEAQDVRIIV